MKPTRPALRYHGGKWMLAPWIISHFPAHRIYVEPYGGAASVLIRKPRAYAEIYNDLSDEIVNLFRVLQHCERSARLVDLLRITPFARVEFNLSYEPIEDEVERARRLVIRSFMGFGSDGCNKAVKTGFRSNSNRSGTTPAHDWANIPDSLSNIIERFTGVVIEHRAATEVMTRADQPDALHYVDPPYVHVTRSEKSRVSGGKYHAYDHEMSDADHREMAEGLRALDGMVVLSGYPSDLYDSELFADWQRIERPALADGARARTEVLWLNEACWEALRAESAAATQQQEHLFEGVITSSSSRKAIGQIS